MLCFDSIERLCYNKSNSFMLAEKILATVIDRPVLILPHDNPDPDALASSWALARLLRRLKKKSAVIAYSGLIGRAENRAMVRELNIPAVKFDPEMLKRNPFIFMVDCQPYTGNSALPQSIIPDAVIDHHPLRNTTKAREWIFIKEKIGATSTLLSSIFRDLNHPISKKMATALFYAIRSETKELGWEGTRLDYDLYLFLLKKVDFKLLYKIEHPPLNAAYFQSIKEALVRSRIHDDLVVCPMEKMPYPELAAEIADFLIYREGIRISLVIGSYHDDLYLSLRSLRPGVNLAEVISRLVKGLGTGGGHEMMAGGKIPKSNKHESEVQRIVIHRLLKHLSLGKEPGKPFF